MTTKEVWDRLFRPDPTCLPPGDAVYVLHYVLDQKTQCEVFAGDAKGMADDRVDELEWQGVRVVLSPVIIQKKPPTPPTEQELTQERHRLLERLAMTKAAIAQSLQLQEEAKKDGFWCDRDAADWAKTMRRDERTMASIRRKLARVDEMLVAVSSEEEDDE